MADAVSNLVVPKSLPIAGIRDQLARARSIWRFSEALSRAFLWTVALVLLFLVFCVLDNLLRLPAQVRLVLSGILFLGGIGSLVAWVVRPLFWKISDQAAAVYLERKLGERENLMINAVQLSGKMTDGSALTFSKNMAQQVVERAAFRAAEMSLAALWEKRRLKRLGIAAFAAIVLIGLYAAILPQYARNAFMRYARPLAGIPPISKTRVFLFPNGRVEMLAGEKLSVSGAAVSEKGDAPAEAVILADLDGARHRIPMARSGAIREELAKEAGKSDRASGFAYEFPNVNKSFSFYLSSGDGESLPCQVIVRERPGVEDLALEITPPEYTGIAKSNEASASGMIHALPSSKVAVSFKPTMTLKSGKLLLPQGAAELAAQADGLWRNEFTVEKEGPYAISLTSEEDVEAPRAFEGQVILRADGLPTVAFENQSLNVAARPGATLPLAVRAQDDFGLKTLRLIVRPGATPESSDDEKSFKQIKAWQYTLPGPRSVNELYPLVLDPATYPAGGTFAVFAEVTDHCPTGKRTCRSAALLIRVLTPDQMELSDNSPFASAFQRIQDLIDQQTKARGKTLTVKEFLSDIVAKNMLPQRMQSIRDAQVLIQRNTVKLIGDLRGPAADKIKDSAQKIVAELLKLQIGPMDKAIKALDDTAAAQKDVNVAGLLIKAEDALQAEIINRLTALLGTVTGLDKKKEEARADLKDDQDGQRLREKLEDAKDKIDKFLDAQKQIIKTTEEFEKKKADDLTEEDQKILGDLAKEEMKWAEYFKEAFTDLSKVPNQDFSNSKLAEEFNEVFQEIRKASEALTAKNHEIAVRAEEGGLELAKQLETNLEKWLPDTRDTESWKMEEPKGEFDVPLADLPQELEDIIGELIDEQEKMTEDVQDTSSSWMDSMDKGAGWDAADGNISNMSAKGVTGNRQPNDMEIGGRSGEGRSGKSTGQFVEETADGKGGKQTPTRATQDPYEQGSVKDSSKEALGGSTGGGKESGNSGMGLRGQPPPTTMKKMERLRENEAQIRQKAEKIVTQLKAYHLPSSDAEEAVRRMKQIENNMKAGNGFELKQAHVAVMDSLKEAKKVVGFQGEINKERTRELPKHVRNKIMSGMQSAAPQGYQDLMEAYYKSLVEPDK